MAMSLRYASVSTQCVLASTNKSSTAQSPHQFFYVANGSCLPCPTVCSTCLPTVEDITYPCGSCHGQLGLISNPHSPLIPGGVCSNCSDLGLSLSSGSRRLRLVSAATAVESSTGTTAYAEGRLEVFYAGAWWSVCDDSWTTINTDVVCREMGYGSGIAYISQYDSSLTPQTSASFGGGNSSSIPAAPKIGFDDVNCTLNAESFFTCAQLPFGAGFPDCESYETVGIRCWRSYVADTCVVNCPVGQMSADNATCVACPNWLTGCLSCKAVPSGNFSPLGVAARCIACESPLWLMPDGTCVSECPTGRYGNFSTGTCDACPSTCLTCVFDAADDQQVPSCSSCSDSTKLLSNGTCVKSCPSETFSQNASACVARCSVGFYADPASMTCRPCSNECLACFGIPSNCTACVKSGHVSMTTSTNNSNGNGVPVVSTSCLPDCPAGYYVTSAADRQCRRCNDSRCARCYPGGFYCSSCLSQSDVIELGRCVTQCSRGLNAVGGGSLPVQRCLPICGDGFYWTDGECEPCSMFCTKCLNVTLCLVCDDEYFVDTSSGLCVSRCPPRTVPFAVQMTSTGASSFYIRTVGGLLPSDGFVEILLRDIWGRLCANHWTINEANVVCQQLQLGTALKVHSSSGPNNAFRLLMRTTFTTESKSDVFSVQEQTATTMCENDGSVVQQVTFNCTGQEKTLSQCHQLATFNCTTQSMVRCSGLDPMLISLVSPAVCTSHSPESCGNKTGCAQGVQCRTLESGSGSFCEPCPPETYGNGSTCILLNAGNSPLSFLYPSDSVTVINYWPQEVDLWLLCVTNQLNKATVTWYKNGTKLCDSAYWRTLQNGMLTLFSPTWRTHSGSYECIVNDTASTQKRRYNVTIQETVRITNPPVDQQSSGAFLLNCGFTGQPQPNSTWTLNYQTIDFARTTDLTPLANGSLLVNSGLPHYSGTYACFVQNGYTSAAAAAANVTITGRPTILNTQTNYTVLAGQRFAVTCRATGSPILQIFWKKNSNSLHNDSTTTVFPNGTLVLRNVTDNVAGQYKCLAVSTAYDSIAVWNLNVTVFVYPSVVINPKSAMVNLSRPVTFDCVVTGRPTPAIVYWSLPNGTTVLTSQTSTSSSYSVSGNSLTISSAWYKDFGNISCIASSLAGRVSATATLIVLGKPRFVQLPADTVLLAGWPSFIPWSISTLESPAIAWFKNGSVIYSLSVNTSGMFLTPRCDIDSGNYTVIAANSYGVVSASAFIRVICKYSLPSIVEAAPNSVQLSLGDSVPQQPSSPLLGQEYFYEVWVISCPLSTANGSAGCQDLSVNPLDLFQNFITTDVSNKTYAIGTYISVVGNCTEMPCVVTVGNELSYQYTNPAVNISVVNYPLMSFRSYAISVRTMLSVNGTSPQAIASTGYLLLQIPLAGPTIAEDSKLWWIIVLIVVLFAVVSVTIAWVISKNRQIIAYYYKINCHHQRALNGLRRVYRRICELVSGFNSAEISFAQSDISAELSSDVPIKFTTSNASLPPATSRERSSLHKSSVALYIPTEDEIERLEEIGINYYDEDDWIRKVPDNMYDVKLHVQQHSRQMATDGMPGSTSTSRWARIRQMIETGVFRKPVTLDLYGISKPQPALNEGRPPEMSAAVRKFPAYHIILGKRYKISPEVGNGNPATKAHSSAAGEPSTRKIWPTVSAFRNACSMAIKQVRAKTAVVRAALWRRLGRQSADLTDIAAADDAANGFDFETVRSFDTDDQASSQSTTLQSFSSSRRNTAANDNVYVGSQDTIDGPSLLVVDVRERPSLPVPAESVPPPTVRRYELPTDGGRRLSAANSCQFITTAMVHEEHVRIDSVGAVKQGSRIAVFKRSVSFDDYSSYKNKLGNGTSILRKKKIWNDSDPGDDDARKMDDAEDNDTGKQTERFTRHSLSTEVVTSETFNLIRVAVVALPETMDRKTEATRRLPTSLAPANSAKLQQLEVTVDGGDLGVQDEFSHLSVLSMSMNSIGEVSEQSDDHRDSLSVIETTEDAAVLELPGVFERSLINSTEPDEHPSTHLETGGVATTVKAREESAYLSLLEIASVEQSEMSNSSSEPENQAASNNTESQSISNSSTFNTENNNSLCDDVPYANFTTNNYTIVGQGIIDTTSTAEL